LHDAVPDANTIWLTASNWRGGAAERLFARLMPISGERLASNVAIVPDASIFKSGRQLAAWLGLVPR
jgi:transposase